MTTATLDHEADYSPAAEVVHDHGERCIDAEQLLTEIVQADRQPSWPELKFFQRQLSWDDRTVKRELYRVREMLRLRAIAGSTADREAAASEAATAAELLATKGAELLQKIAKLQEQYDALERDSRLSQKRVAEQTEAAEKLRKLVPEHVRLAVQADITGIQRSTGREVSALKSRIEQLEACLDPRRFDSPSLYLQVVRRNFPDAVTKIIDGRTMHHQLSPQWSTIRTQIERELAEQRDQLADLQRQYADQIRTAELPLSYYAG